MGFDILCTLLGHEYKDAEVTETEETDENGNQVAVKTTEEPCKRCDYERKHRRRTRVVQADEKESKTDTDTTQQTEITDNDDDVEVTYSPDSNSTQSKDSTTTEIEDSGTGVIIDDEAQDTIDPSPVDDTETLVNDANETSVSAAKTNEDTAVVLEKLRSESSDSTVRIIDCEECSFKKTTGETARRDGDLCPDCSSWLSVTVQDADDT